MASHLVSQHQIGNLSAPVNGDPGDATVVLGNENAIIDGYNPHDSDATIHVQSSSAAVFGAVAAGTEGRKWMTQDTGAVYLYLDTGSAWVEVNYLRQAANGTVVVTSTTTPQLTVAYDGSNSLTVSVSSAGAVTLNATGASAGFTFSDVVTLSSGGPGALKLLTTANGTYGADATIRWYRADGTTLKSFLGFNANDSQVLTIGTTDATGSVVITSGNNTTAITIASNQAVTFAAGISATTVTLSGAATALRVYTGSTLATNCVSGAATTVQAIPDVKGIYAVSVFGGNATAAFGYFYANGAGSMAAFGTSLTGSASAFGTSGMNVRFTQSSGSDMSVDAYYTRVG